MKSAAKLGSLVLLPLMLFAAAGCEKKSDVTTVAHKWGWISGAETVNPLGVYGALATPAATNVPGSREGAASWRDASGRFWFFGGYGFDAAGYRDRLNDLWVYDPTSGNWTWMAGGSSVDEPAVYGTRGVASASNIPGARNGSVAWVDAGGTVWLFGGFGFTTAGEYGNLNDLWTYDAAAGEWTWVMGSNAVDPSGVYGTKGTPASSNIPGGRFGAVSATGEDGRFWLFGGYGQDASGNAGWLNDLWTFDPATRQWTWISGGDADGSAGTYGTKGTAAAANVPGSRYMGVAWLDPDGVFWLFGGEGLDSAETHGLLNDLWKYDPSVGQWTWVTGGNTVQVAGTYTAVDTESSTDAPGSRTGSVSWIDSDGYLWLFGGYGLDSTTFDRWLNDLWKFNPSKGYWTWISGSSTGGAKGVYGTKGTPASTNVPGARFSSVSWRDGSGKLWFFGGYGADSAGTGGWLNDLWQFTK